MILLKKNVDDSEKFYDYYHFNKHMDVFYEIRRICKENNILKDLNNQIEILRIKSFRLRKNGKNTVNERNSIGAEIDELQNKIHKILSKGKKLLI